MAIVLLALALAAGAVQAPAQAPPAPAPIQSPAPSLAYSVGANDSLSVKVFDEPGLTGVFKVDADGSITYPLLGRVAVAGKNVREIEGLLTTMLMDGWVNRPQVSVEMAEFRSRSVFIVGEVRSPGKYPIIGEVTLLEVLAQAGSLTATASNLVRVLRDTDPTNAGTRPAIPGGSDTREVMLVNLDDLKSGKMAGANTVLQDGDTIVVVPAERFYITGFVRNPGTFPLAANMTVEQAIAVAGGLSDRGSKNGIKIRRTVNGKEVEVKVKPNDRVLPGDTIVIRQRYI